MSLSEDLAARAAMALENARLYESLVSANKDLTQANISLEENFRQTERFTTWREAIGPHFAAAPHVEQVRSGTSFLLRV